MLLITCPWCGDRDEPEFSYGGQAHVPYPADPEALDDEEWARYLFFRDNPAGPYAERWVHTAGCRRWFNAVRDTRTNEFIAFYPAGTPRPNASAGEVRDDAASTGPPVSEVPNGAAPSSGESDGAERDDAGPAGGRPLGAELRHGERRGVGPGGAGSGGAGSRGAASGGAESGDAALGDAAPGGAAPGGLGTGDVGRGRLGDGGVS